MTEVVGLETYWPDDPDVLVFDPGALKEKCCSRHRYPGLMRSRHDG